MTRSARVIAISHIATKRYITTGHYTWSGFQFWYLLRLLPFHQGPLLLFSAFLGLEWLGFAKRFPAHGGFRPTFFNACRNSLLPSASSFSSVMVTSGSGCHFSLSVLSLSSAVLRSFDWIHFNCWLNPALLSLLMMLFRVPPLSSASSSASSDSDSSDEELGGWSKPSSLILFPSSQNKINHFLIRVNNVYLDTLYFVLCRLKIGFTLCCWWRLLIME